MPARWLPRVLAAAIVVSGWLAVSRLPPDAAAHGSRTLRGLVVVVAAIAALWVVRRGGEVRIRVGVDSDGLRFEHRGRSALLRFEDVESLRYEAPFGPGRAWLPATVLTDTAGREWRLCGLLAGGERLVARIVAASGRSDLGAWVEAQGIASKMARSRLRVGAGYAVAGALLAVSVLYASL